MTTIDDVVKAIRAADSDAWSIADAIAEMPETDNAGNKWTYQRMSDEIWNTVGIEWTTNVITRYAATARAFPKRTRVVSTSFSAHVELRGAPERLTAWAAANPGRTLTVESARNMRGGGSGGSGGVASVPARLKRLAGQLDAVADDDPAMTIEMLEAKTMEYRNRYGKRIDKANRGLSSVAG